MSVPTYLGFLAITFAVAVGIKWYQPAVVDQVARQTGFSGRKGWAVLAVTSLWAFLPLLAGAGIGDDELWVAGAAVVYVGAYLLVIAAGSIDEYRLLSQTEHVPPGKVTPGEDLVATSGVPSVDDESAARTPLAGVPAVHTDWLVQRRERVGFRRTWTALASGVTAADFTLGDGAVRVSSGRHRVFSNAEHRPAFDPDEEVPEAAAAFLRDHPDLPAPEARDETLRFHETYVPADGPVTVVGRPRQGETPGTVVVDEAPPDDVLGTHTDHSTPAETDPEAVLIQGDADAAETRLRRRVYWLGAAGAAMVLGGQLLSFWLSPATWSALV